MKMDAVLKIGGSLGRGDDLPCLCRQIGSLGKSRRLLVVPGGGDFADLVRKAYLQYALGETAAHCMAVLAMDQYGYVLNRLMEQSFLVRDWTALNEESSAGKVAILLPSTWMTHRDPLPHSWDVTSDSIAAWVAAQLECRLLILLKDVDGLWDRRHENAAEKIIMPELTVPQLAGHAGGVDPYLWRILESSDMETWIINGTRPSRLAELVTCGRTTGTRIVSRSAGSA